MKLEILYSLAIISFVSLIMFSCSRKGKIDNNVDDFQVTLKTNRGRSKARPQYNISLDGRKVSYNGIANMDSMGEKSFEISKANYSKIRKAFLESNFTSFKNEYKGRMRDLPMPTLTYNGHIVRYQEREAPPELLNLANLMKELIPKGEK